VVRAACACARTSLRYVAPGEHRPLRAIETAEAWTRDEAAIDDVRRAADAGNAAAYAAAYAAAKDASYTSYDAAAAAYASARASAGYDSATPVALREQVGLVRAIVPCPVEVQP